MKVNLKCFAELASRYECRYDESAEIEISEGTTVKQLLKNRRIPEEKVKISFVNGIISGADHQLNNGDDLTLVPATGGM